MEKERDEQKEEGKVVIEGDDETAGEEGGVGEGHSCLGGDKSCSSREGGEELFRRGRGEKVTAAAISLFLLFFRCSCLFCFPLSLP